ncbi:hypothetical protein OIU77_018712 [Salix suchowensis]|uniref:Uncharacterized protein n=1 Tax=Salix suchowensis TaxID=1278906 RepID=A0ABQ9CDD7_9ROSI|nr:hypothetical protein OIU77_018712 [Salix suchowensis]
MPQEPSNQRRKITKSRFSRLYIRTIERFKGNLTETHFTARSDDKNVFHFLDLNIHGSYKQGRLVRWQLWLQSFNFTVEHIAGTTSALADCRSRELAETCQKSWTISSEKWS